MDESLRGIMMKVWQLTCLFPATGLRRRMASAMCLSVMMVAGHSSVSAAASEVADLSGVWNVNLTSWTKGNEIPYTPAYAAKTKIWIDASEAGHPFPDSVGRCEAFGMPGIMGYGVMELLQTPGRVTIITEILHEVRRIYTDGRTAPKSLDSSYDGYSVGRWEKGTLVVETVGLQENTIDKTHWHSDQLKVIERISLINANKLLDRMTLIDPKAFTRPWTVDRTFDRAPKNWEIGEYICETGAIESQDDKKQ